jgi:hypothetical protein
MKEEYKRGRKAETLSWSSPGEEAAVRVVIDLKDEAKKYAEKWSEEKHVNAHTWWTDGSQSDDGEWEPYAATAEEAGRSSAATSGKDEWRWLMPSCGRCGSLSKRLQREQKDCLKRRKW